MTKAKMSKREVICEFCGKKFLKSDYEIKRYKHNFCSQDCFKKWEKKYLSKGD